MNAKAKGNRNRRKTIDRLTAEGWVVAVVERTGRFIKEKDAYGLFDLIAIKPNCTMLVQCSTNDSKTKEPFQTFANKYAGESLRVVEITQRDRDEPKITEFKKVATPTLLENIKDQLNQIQGEL